MDPYSVEKKDSSMIQFFLVCNIMAHIKIAFETHFKKTSKHSMVVPRLACTFQEANTTVEQ